MGKNDRLWHSTENRSSSFLEVVVDRSPSVDSHTQKTTETQRIVLKIASQSRQDLAKALCVTIQHESLPEVYLPASLLIAYVFCLTVEEPFLHVSRFVGKVAQTHTPLLQGSQQ
jgi:hypothetical protein